MGDKVEAALQRTQLEHLADARVYPDIMFADRQVLADEIERLRTAYYELAEQLYHTFRTAAVEMGAVVVTVKFEDSGLKDRAEQLLNKTGSATTGLFNL